MSLTQGAITTVNVEEPNANRVLGFFDPETLGTALKEAGFVPGEELQMLIDIMRTAENPWVRMKAIAMLVNRAEQSAKAAGMLQESNRYLEATVDKTKVLLESRALQMLPMAADQQRDYEENKRAPEESIDVIDITPEPHTGAEPTTPDSKRTCRRDAPEGLRDVAVEGSDEVVVVGVTDGHFPPKRGSAGLAQSKKNYGDGLPGSVD